MPEPSEFDNEKDWMAVCVPKHMDEGQDQEQAVAACLNQWRERKSIDIGALKIGMRNNRADRDAIRQIRGAARQIHDITVTLEPNDADPEPEVPEVVQIAIASAPVKALGDGRIGGYLIRFTNSDEPDLVGDYFNAETDFGIEPPTKIPAFFHHGMDPRKKRLNNKSMTISDDEFGLWAETILDERDKYEAFLYDLAKQGKLGLSSGAASHLYDSEPVDKANHITSWIIAEGSVTHIPAEPRNTVIPLKSLGQFIPPLELPVEAAPQAELQPQQLSEVINMDITKEELSELLNAATKNAVDEALKSLPPVNATPAQVVVTKDEGDQPFASDGEFFKAVKNAAYYPSREDVRLRSLKATGMSENVPSDGGYLLPQGMAAGIMSHMLEGGEILSRVPKDSVSGNSMTYNGIDESTHATSLFGGLIGYWLNEGGTKTASAPKFWQLELKLKKIAVLAYCTDEQLEDTPALQTWLTRNVPDVLRWYVEDAIIAGDGVGKPSGVTNSPAVISVLREDANEINPSDFAQMWSRRYIGAKDYVWLINPTVGAWMNTFAVGTFPVYMPSNNMVGKPFGTVYGAPVIESEHVAAAKSAGDVLLVAFSQYQAIDKGGIQSASSIHVAFTTDETAFRFVYRIDGGGLWNSALTPKNGSTISPFVSLGAASS